LQNYIQKHFETSSFWKLYYMNYLQSLASDTEIKVSKLSRLLLFSCYMKCCYEKLIKRCSRPLHCEYYVCSFLTQKPKVFLWPLLAGFQQRRAGFDLESGDVGFVVDKAALRHVFSEYFGFPSLAFHRLLHTHHHHSKLVASV
jgi:hypothetical protein